MLERIILTLVKDTYTTKAKVSIDSIKIYYRDFMDLMQISILLVIYVIVLFCRN